MVRSVSVTIEGQVRFVGCGRDEEELEELEVFVFELDADWLGSMKVDAKELEGTRRFAILSVESVNQKIQLRANIKRNGETDAYHPATPYLSSSSPQPLQSCCCLPGSLET